MTCEVAGFHKGGIPTGLILTSDPSLVGKFYLLRLLDARETHVFEERCLWVRQPCEIVQIDHAGYRLLGKNIFASSDVSAQNNKSIND